MLSGLLSPPLVSEVTAVMRWLWIVLVLALGGCLATQPSPKLAVPPAPAPTIQYTSHTLPQAIVHTLTIPLQSFKVTVAIAPAVDSLENFAQRTGAIAVLNGGFFDPENQQSTSHVVQQGAVVGDPQRNDRLMNNPDLAPYLPKILDRSEFRRYQCDQTLRYDIVRRSELPPMTCQLVDALGGGPQLLPEMTLEAEGFLAVSNGKPSRDPLGSRQPNARTAIALTQDSLIWAMVAQTSPTSGLSLAELAAFLRTLGATKAMNLDGGSSASLYYNGKIRYGKMDQSGDRVQRPVKSVLLVQAMK